MDIKNVSTETLLRYASRTAHSFAGAVLINAARGELRRRGVEVAKPGPAPNMGQGEKA